MLESIGSLIQNLPLGQAAGAESSNDTGLLGGLLGGISSPGGMVEGFLDELGLPDWAGDLAKMFCAASTGDVPGAVAGYLDAMEDAFDDIGLEQLGDVAKSAAEVTEQIGGAATGDPGVLAGDGATSIRL